jgi:hypothetical protein
VITTPTVLVLGAGASYPYGFPTAKELKGIICDTFEHPTSIAKRLGGDYPNYSADSFFEFREAFLKSGQPSVDAFLERRPSFLNVGKFAIAYCLIPFENENNLYKPTPSRGGDWYEYLSVKLNSSFEDFGKNELSIITFNYDRSLEHYLLNSLHYLHGKPFDECANMLSQIPIIHVYGQLGEPAYPEKGSWEYRPNQDGFENVLRAAAGITLYHEEAAGGPKAAQAVLRAATRVCFLGFSYHELNVARLDIGGSFDLRHIVMGTARGLKGMEVQGAKNKLNAALGGNIELIDADNLDLLRRYMLLG